MTGWVVGHPTGARYGPRHGGGRHRAGRRAHMPTHPERRAKAAWWPTNAAAACTTARLSTKSHVCADGKHVTSLCDRAAVFTPCCWPRWPWWATRTSPATGGTRPLGSRVSRLVGALFSRSRARTRFPLEPTGRALRRRAQPSVEAAAEQLNTRARGVYREHQGASRPCAGAALLTGRLTFAIRRPAHTEQALVWSHRAPRRFGGRRYRRRHRLHGLMPWSCAGPACRAWPEHRR